MTIWIDAQLSPAIAVWINSELGLDAAAVRDIGLREAEDIEIFDAAKLAGAIVITKDKDFVHLLNRLGPPPSIIWLTCGNTSNVRLKEIPSELLSKAIKLLESGEPLVEINSPD